MQESAIQVAAFPVAQVVPVVFFLIFFVWAVYTVVAIYHWLRYGSDTAVALCAISVHLLMSAWIAIYAVGGITGST